MTPKQVLVGWLGLALIVLNLFLTDQWSIIWGNTIGRGSYHYVPVAPQLDPGINNAFPGANGPQPTPGGKQKKPVGEK